MAYPGRPLSPGGKRTQNPGRTSDNRLSEAPSEQSRSDRYGSYTSPRSSGGVVPISSETFVNYPPPESTQPRYDSYGSRLPDTYSSARPRQGSGGEVKRIPASSTAQSSARSKPTVVQATSARPTSPTRSSQWNDYYTTPAASKEPPKEGHTKKVYSVANGTASLVADVNLARDGERHHKRRDSESGDRGGYMRPPSERDKARRGYHLNGPKRRAPKDVDDEDAYEYTNAAGMFRDTEPVWRPRRNSSIDRAGGSHERPVSMLDPAFDPRRSARDFGPPVTTRGWDKVNDLARSSSVKDRPREVPQSPTMAKSPLSPREARMPQSPTRGRYLDPGHHGDPRDPYYVPPRVASIDDRNRYPSVNQDRANERYAPLETREPRRQERRNSTTRVPDRSVERRGFGIRNDPRDSHERDSSESFNQQDRQQDRYRDSGHIEPPRRRDTAPDSNQYDEQRPEQEKRDRQQDREAREKDYRRREEDSRGYNDNYERDRSHRRSYDTEHNVDRDRERERERMMQPQPEPERHQHRHNSYRGDYDRSPRDTSETIAQPGLSTAAAGGIAGAAAAYGLSSYQNRSDDRDRDRGRDVDSDRRRDRSDEYDRERMSPKPAATRQSQDKRATESHSEESTYAPQERDRYRNDDQDRGLGFAFERPQEPPKPAPATRDRSDTATSRASVDERDFERSHEDEPPEDPDEEYRRRKEQIQRELGRAPDDRASDSDPERQRRKREREQRLRERQHGFSDSPVAANSTFSETPSTHQMPGSFDNESLDRDEPGGAGQTLRRRRSILDEPLTDEPAQIIDNSQSERRENRVQIVEPPTEEEERRPKGILKKPKARFPDYPDEVREGVAPLKDATKSGIPPGARWTKIDRRLVNPEALEEAKERFEERQDCVIVLRVLTREDIQKLADRTKAIRDERYRNERHDREDRDDRDDRRASRRESRRERDRDRHGRDEYVDDDSENEFKPRAPKMLEAPAAAGPSSGDQSDYNRDYKDRDRKRDRDGGERDSQYSGGGK